MNKYAVLVGIGDNQRGRKLDMDKDARLMASILYGAEFDRKNVQLLLNRQAKRQDVLDAIYQLGNCKEDSTVVVLIGCHGARNLLMLDDGGINGAMVEEALSGLKSQKQLVMINACYSGSFIPYIEGDNRIALTSSTAYTVPPGGFKLTRWGRQFLLEGIKERGLSIQQAYDYGNMGLMVNNYGQEFYL